MKLNTEGAADFSTLPENVRLLIESSKKICQEGADYMLKSSLCEDVGIDVDDFESFAGMSFKEFSRYFKKHHYQKKKTASKAKKALLESALRFCKEVGIDKIDCKFLVDHLAISQTAFYINFGSNADCKKNIIAYAIEKKDLNVIIQGAFIGEELAIDFLRQNFVEGSLEGAFLKLRARVFPNSSYEVKK